MSKVSVIKEACNKRFSEEIRSLREHRASGSKVIGYTCNAFPCSVAAGLGFWPVRVLCSASADAESYGEQLARSDVCPLVKSLLGNISQNRGLHADIDIWVGLYTCDQMRRGMDIVSERLKKEVHPVQVPSTRTDDAAKYYASQIKRFVKDAEAQHGVSFDSELAMKWQSKRELSAAVLADAVKSCEISPLELHAMFHLFFVARPEGLAEFFKGIISDSLKFKSKKRIVLTGSPLTLEDTVVLEALEEKGVSVIPLNCTGLNCIDGGLSVQSEDLIGSFSISAFSMHSCMRARPNTSVYNRIAETLKSTGADGLLVKCLKFCDHWYTERERLRKTFNLPVLVFDSDYSDGGHERLLSRIDAFLEIL